MAFLTPLYLLAGLAVGLPIFFHLIRQTPKGRQVFSSLMFLEPSPPKVTQRSRIEDWLLLLLRALAVCLLAIAFARPFLRSQAQAASEQHSGNQYIILIDQSASMQREDLWQQAVNHVQEVLQSVDANDSVSVYYFNESMQQIINFSDWSTLDSASRKKFVMEKLKELEPSDYSTNLGASMMSAADYFPKDADKNLFEKRLIVVSDFQTGSHWEELNGYTWPDKISVELKRVSVVNPSNTAVHVVANGAPSAQEIRIRIMNNSLSEQEQFKISWLDEFSETDGLSIDAENTIESYVPPGQSRVILAPTLTDDSPSQRLILKGDDQSFDNLTYYAQRPVWQAKILFLGEENETGPDSLRFFLAPVFPETPDRTVKIVDWESDLMTPDQEEEISTVIIGQKLNEQQVKWCQNWLSEGGRGIFVSRDFEQAADIYELLEIPSEPIQEAEIVDYEMLESVDLTHPVFSPFDDPRYSDFSKLRFWKHRVFDPESLPDIKVLAELESGLPAIFELSIGDGKLIVFAAGWNRSDSDLAVWSKFVPMMNGLLEYLGKQQDYSSLTYVGETLDIFQFRFESEQIVMRTPSLEIVKVDADSQTTLNERGIYTLAASEKDLGSDIAVQIAVNLNPDESKTDPVTLDLLKSAGVPISSNLLGASEGEKTQAAKRQLMSRELESQQKIWVWLLFAALVILFLETILAGIRSKNLNSSMQSADV